VVDQVKGFFDFARERHLVWHRRLVERRPRPWTADPVLDRFQFTNVYRELDRGTIWLWRHVLRPRPGRGWERDREALWKILVYRLVNRATTFAAVPIPRWGAWRAERAGFKRGLKRLPGPVFTAAHQLFPPRFTGQPMIDRLVEMLDENHPRVEHATAARLGRTARDPAALFRELRGFAGLGSFRAGEVIKDLMLAGAVGYGENDWVNPGPGCLAGLRLVLPAWISAPRAALDHLRAAQVSRLGADFPYLLGRRLSLCNLEHALCEYFKYARVRGGGARPRRRYASPRTRPDPGLYDRRGRPYIAGEEEALR
jgi:hypothetical protein